MKLAVIVLGAALLILLLIRGIMEITIPRTEGEYLSLQEAGNMPGCWRTPEEYPTAGRWRLFLRKMRRLKVTAC